MARILAAGAAWAPVSSRAMSHDTPPFHFRAAVIVGCLALLVGVAGIFVFERADEGARAGLPADALGVVVRGLPDGEGHVLQASWTDDEGAEQREVGKPAGRDAHFVFYRAPSDAPITLEVLRQRAGAAHVLHAQPALLTPGGLFEVWMPGAR